jgi:hypothetical protein
VAIDSYRRCRVCRGSLQGEQYRQEKAMVGFDLQVGTAVDAAERVGKKRDQIAVERRSAEEEQRAQDARQEEARQSISRIESDQREADDALNRAQRRLFDAREAMQAQANRTAEAKATHAALVERTSALAVGCVARRCERGARNPARDGGGPGAAGARDWAQDGVVARSRGSTPGRLCRAARTGP